MSCLVIHRPVLPVPGNGRRFRLSLDERPLERLALGATVQLPVYSGPHLLRFSCWSMGTAEIIFSALPGGRITVVAYADTQAQLCLCLDNPDAGVSSPWWSDAS
jgi:hypothetical protein